MENEGVNNDPGPTAKPSKNAIIIENVTVKKKNLLFLLKNKMIYFKLFLKFSVKHFRVGLRGSGTGYNGG